MTITWLGQAGLMFETCDKIIFFDPYLSNSCYKKNPMSDRRVTVDERFFNINPDIIVLTHSHLDHTDPETLEKFLKAESGITVLASKNAWDIARTFGGNNNYVSFNRHTIWTEGEVRFEAVFAEHSDDHAIGVIMEAEGKRFYITGDTLYSTEIFKDLPKDIDAVFLPINGKGNNMNMQDAKHFCEEIGAVAVPMHCGLFDDIDMNQWEYEEKVVPSFFDKIIL